MSNYNDGIDQSEIEGLEKENSEYYNRCEDLLVEKESLEKQLSDANATINQILYDKFIKAIGTEVEVRMKGGEWHKKILADYQGEYNCPFITKAGNDLPLSYAEGGDYWDECQLIDCESPEIDLEKTIVEVRAELEAVRTEHRRLVRDLDVELNGEEGAAQQASLCDLVAQAEKFGPNVYGQLESVTRQLSDLKEYHKYEMSGVALRARHAESQLAEANALIAEMRKGEPVATLITGPYGYRSALARKIMPGELDGEELAVHPLYLAPTLPEGWKAVPVESTDEMGDAMNDAWLDITRKPIPLDTPSLHDIYEAAIAAAPELPK